MKDAWTALSTMCRLMGACKLATLAMHSTSPICLNSSPSACMAFKHCSTNANTTLLQGVKRVVPDAV